MKTLLNGAAMNANEIEKKVPGSKLLALGAAFYLAGSLIMTLAGCSFVFGIYWFFIR